MTEAATDFTVWFSALLCTDGLPSRPQSPSNSGCVFVVISNLDHLQMYAEGAARRGRHRTGALGLLCQCLL